MLTVQDLHDRAGKPDLSHWNAAEAFTVMEAAILTAGADPLEYTDIEALKRRGHPNWKNAAIILRGMCESICTDQLNVLEVWRWASEQFDSRKLDPSEVFMLTINESEGINPNYSRLSRKALFTWYEKKGYLRAKSLAPVSVLPPVKHAGGEILDVDFKAASTVLALPAFLDPAHEFSAVELRAANEAWLSVVENGDPKLAGSAVKAKLRKFLDDHHEYQSLSNEAKSRVCTVSNWNKKGGATPTPD